MLIVIEGIDGSGKSTTAALVAERLNDPHGSPVHGGKTDIGPAGEETVARATRLRDLIWSTTESGTDTFGAAHWILLIASWYAGLARLRPDLAPDHPGVCVMDGWYYRNIAKTVVREPLDPQWVESLFAPVREPDLVVLLDVAPEVAWSRRAGAADTDTAGGFKDTEIGRWDGFTGPPRASFCAYQGVIRGQLLRMAGERGWLVLTPDADATPEAIADTIAERVRTLGGRARTPGPSPRALRDETTGAGPG
ncbi:hypothetical protein AB0B95_28965 [Streptomyces hygroscopicus]|uniref:dTMP kinase n=1 Tax=Streptomyces hygroscopicus TaxID=1912 RepID=UPI000B20CA48|nr:hypothetical protein [Streptomyces hygroscopicus]